MTERKKKEKKIQRISTCRSRAYYVSAGQKDLGCRMGAIQSPDFYANLQTGFVGRFEDKVGRISCALCFELGNTFPLTKPVLQNYK